jgi:hypothetical protein
MLSPEKLMTSWALEPELAVVAVVLSMVEVKLP